MNPRLRLPRPALFVACIALFVALGGGAYAATSTDRSTLTWHDATTMNGWQLYQNGYANAGYAIDSNGVVHLRGALKDGSTGNAAFTLPEAYRPTHDLYLPIYTYNGNKVGALNILSNGDVIPAQINGYVTDYTGLDGISFGAGE